MGKDIPELSDIERQSQKSGTTLELFPSQAKFAEEVFKAKNHTYVFAGSIRGGKTICIMVLVLLLCRIYRGSKWVVIREDRETLRTTTLASFFHYVLPPNFIQGIHYLFNKSELSFTFPMWGNSQVLFMSEAYQEDKDFNRFKGLEVNGAFLSQAEGLQAGLYHTMVQRCGQWKIDPMPPAFIFVDLNPTDGWAKQLWYDKFKSKSLPEGTYFQEASIYDNPHISKEYLNRLEETMPPEMFKRFVKNDWEGVESINRLVPSVSIFRSKELLPDAQNKDKGTIYLGCDVGHRGQDPSTMCVMDGGNIIEMNCFRSTNLNDVEQWVFQKMNEYQIKDDHVVIDGVGVGAGLVDNMENKGMYPIRMIGGSREVLETMSIDGLRFAHWKALSYYVAADMMRKGNIGNFQNSILIGDAQAVYHYIRKEREIMTESKEELRARIGRSCDYWDAFVYACWARYQHKVFGSNKLFTSSMFEAERKVATEKLELQEA